MCSFATKPVVESWLICDEPLIVPLGKIAWTLPVVTVPTVVIADCRKCSPATKFVVASWSICDEPLTTPLPPKTCIEPLITPLVANIYPETLPNEPVSCTVKSPNLISWVPLTIKLPLTSNTPCGIVWLLPIATLSLSLMWIDISLWVLLWPIPIVSVLPK